MGTEDTELLSTLDAMHSPREDFKAEPTPADADFWWKLVHLDPAILRGAIVSFIALAATLGLYVSDQKQTAIFTFAGSLLALVQALWTRKAVTPNAKVVVYKPDPVGRPSVVAPGEAISTDIVSVANAAADSVQMDRQVQDLPFPGRVK